MGKTASRGSERDERKQTSVEASKPDQATSKPGSIRCPEISTAATYLLAVRCPVCRRRDSHSGSRVERENLAGDAKGKGASGYHREAENTDAPERGGLPRSSDEAAVMVVERRGWVIAVGLGPTGSLGGALSFNGRRQPSRDGTSRMMREHQVRICERLGVKLLGPTRRIERFTYGSGSARG